MYIYYNMYIRLSDAVGCTHKFLILYYSYTSHKVEYYSHSWQTGSKLYMECRIGRNHIARHYAEHYIPRHKQKEIAETQTALQHAVAVEENGGKTEDAAQCQYTKETTYRVVGTRTKHHHKIVHLEAYAHRLWLKATQRHAKTHHRRDEREQKED